MKGVLMMLKAFGVEITPQQAAMLQGLIPQIPGMVNQLINTVNSWDARIKRIEQMTEEINGRERERDNERRAGTSSNIQ
jgi:predicted PurR-regulated permease PerM